MQSPTRKITVLDRVEQIAPVVVAISARQTICLGLA
jgi:hypothetical protein